MVIKIDFNVAYRHWAEVLSNPNNPVCHEALWVTDDFTITDFLFMLLEHGVAGLEKVPL
jgi:hypothetical protein